MRSIIFSSLLALAVLAPTRASAQGKNADAPKFPPELVQFTAHKTNPVFAAAKGQWDSRIRERGWIMIEDGVYKLWYTGYDGPDGLRMLGYATSKDGIEWTRHPKNPLVKDEWVEDMMIVKNAGKYWMFAEGRHDRAHLLVSENGIDWKRWPARYPPQERQADQRRPLRNPNRLARKWPLAPVLRTRRPRHLARHLHRHEGLD
jgi:predicted GH43/DUF377 family glycosyl hydrolase